MDGNRCADVAELSSWRLVLPTTGPACELTGHTIVTKRNGENGHRQELRFRFALVSTDGAISGQQPPPLPEALYIRSVLCGRSFCGKRLSLAVWDALGSQEHERRLVDAQKNWPSVCLVSLCHANTYQAVENSIAAACPGGGMLATNDIMCTDAVLRSADGSCHGARGYRVDCDALFHCSIVFYACAVGLEGGELEISLSPPEAMLVSATLRIPWRT
eukprot:gnl/TRDRNA2_/TRDRNA2_92241_c0_seq2.p1 gnl/TRDRNA2_/TRDRNA2_92241_c0~~gnl/TRDRNA2_/TRDRNA2_92241_c0_seq2.p1  ORF type:complete len:217 (+),score=17.49 gnl/TRDRNA2_/TRDRNA2_92241_c0_seq2:38-688(+)